jgi:hypothetical protein
LQEIQKAVSWNGRCLQNGKIVLILYNIICIIIYDYNHIHNQEKWWYVVGLVQVKCSANIMVFTCVCLINKCRGSLPSVLQTDALTLRWHHEMPVVWGSTVTVTFAWVWNALKYLTKLQLSCSKLQLESRWDLRRGSRHGYVMVFHCISTWS